MYQIFLIQISSDRVELALCGSVIKIDLNFKSRGTVKSDFSRKRPTTFKFWETKVLLWLNTNTQNFEVSYAGYKVIAERL